MIDIQAWENSVLGQHLNSDGVKADAGQCSQVPVSWVQALFPGVAWPNMLPAIGSDKGVSAWAGHSTKYLTWIENNHVDVNQLPMPGDILVFTPDHTGVCKSASATGYTLIEQNAPKLGDGVHDSSYPWIWGKRKCLGWFRPNNLPAPNPVPAPAPVMSSNVGRILHLPKNNTGKPNKYVPVFNVGGPFDAPHATHGLNPFDYGDSNGLDYQIKRDLGNGLYVISTSMFGDVAIAPEGYGGTITGDVPRPPAPATRDITVQPGWGLSNVAQAAGVANPGVPATWQRIAQANGSGSWQDFNRALKSGQVVRVPLQ